MGEENSVCLTELVICIVDFSTPISVIGSTLQSLSNALASVTGNWSLQIVDNGNRASILVSLLEQFPQLNAQIVSGHGNIGFGAGNNRVIRSADAKFTLILNPDVQMQADVLALGMAYLCSNPDVVAIVPRTYNINGDVEHLCRRYPRIRSIVGRATRGRLFGKFVFDYEMRNLDWTIERDDFCVASGCFMLVRTGTLKCIGGFDERYFLYFEDYDLVLRLRKYGRIAYLPQMKIRHLGGNTASKGWLHWKYFFLSAIRFFDMHGWRW